MDTKAIRPLLASPFDQSKVKFPTLLSAKLDGIRCLVIDGVAMTRSMKPIPNGFVQSVFASGVFNGLDGELIVGRPNAPDVYLTTNSSVMSKDGAPDFTFYVFDRWDTPTIPYHKRLISASTQLSSFRPQRSIVLTQFEARNAEDVFRFEQRILDLGYEGVIGRDPVAPYKFGRSTAKEGFLWKLKRFTDAEFEVIGVEELMHNDNEAFINELGYTERTSHQDGKRGGGVLGALILKFGDNEFRCGTGFSAEQRKVLWEQRKSLIGRQAKVKYFAVGVKDLPRHPVWLGFRDEKDL